MKKEKILVTGCAGFIGMHACTELIKNNYKVLGIDNLNHYYNQKLKLDRLKNLSSKKSFSFKKLDISKSFSLDSAFKEFCPDKVLNLAAQAGVQYSINNPHKYIKDNVVGFMNILESCRHHKVKGLIYASSSSIYGKNDKIPFCESDNTNKPISIYGATKMANELMAHSYSSLFGIHTTGLRFFSVYGPWGRPDMAMYIFTQKILEGKPISIFNNGNMERDFTYIDDIVEGIIKSIEKNYLCEIFNLGNSHSENLMDMIKHIENNLNKRGEYSFEGMQKGDVKKTISNIERSKKLLDFNPKTPLPTGIEKFVRWYRDYHK